MQFIYSLLSDRLSTCYIICLGWLKKTNFDYQHHPHQTLSYRLKQTSLSAAPSLTEYCL